jgi:hypothetical protein
MGRLLITAKRKDGIQKENPGNLPFQAYPGFLLKQG